MKLKISTQPERDVAPMKEVYTYRWDRILLALLGLLLTIGLVLAAVHQLNKDRADSTTLADAGLEATRASPDAAAAEPPAVPEIREPTPQPAPARATNAGAPAETPRPMAKSTTPNATARQSLPTEQPPLQAPEEAPRQTEPASDTSASQRAVEEPAASDSLFGTPSTTILSPNIKRFMLAAAIKDKEPVGTVQDITPDSNDVASLYAYSEVVDMKDSTLYYVWSLNGKEIAKVRVPVWSNRWRSYSSKLITRKMQGSWKVELVDKTGQLLANSEFTY